MVGGDWNMTGLFFITHLYVTQDSPINAKYIYICVIGGLEHEFYFPCHINGMSSFPLTNSYLSEGLKPPIPENMGICHGNKWT